MHLTCSLALAPLCIKCSALWNENKNIHNCCLYCCACVYCGRCCCYCCCCRLSVTYHSSIVFMANTHTHTNARVNRVCRLVNKWFMLHLTRIILFIANARPCPLCAQWRQTGSQLDGLIIADINVRLLSQLRMKKKSGGSQLWSWSPSRGLLHCGSLSLSVSPVCAQQLTCLPALISIISAALLC